MNVAFLLLAGSLNRWVDLSPTVWIPAAVAAAAIAIAVALWRKIVSMLSRLIYRLPVEGKWNTQWKEADKMVDHESARLFQFGSRVWGQTKTKDADRRRYRLRGRITGEKLCLIYRETTGNRLDTGAILLQIRPNGNAMDGYEVGLDLKSNNITAREYEWKRVAQ
jgi:hypothetical protein